MPSRFSAGCRPSEEQNRLIESTYRGRFAPTPSGPLHLGSLLTALASYLEARRHGGRWLLRIDDLDTQRIAAGAEAQILHQLESHGLEWDGPIRRQSEHIEEYQAALDSLKRQGALYGCRCSRAVLAQSSLPGADGPVYSGHCRQLGLVEGDLALRVIVPGQQLRFLDAGQGMQHRDLARDIGDFIVRRRDGIIAYQLACAVDEHVQMISHVVRGADLLGSTFMQLLLMQRLRLREPRYHHLPILVDREQRKFSKQNHALAIHSADAGLNLFRCLEWLGQSPPPALQKDPARLIIGWALAHWDLSQVPRQAAIEPRTL